MKRRDVFLVSLEVGVGEAGERATISLHARLCQGKASIDILASWLGASAEPNDPVQRVIQRYDDPGLFEGLINVLEHRPTQILLGKSDCDTGWNYRIFQAGLVGQLVTGVRHTELLTELIHRLIAGIQRPGPIFVMGATYTQEVLIDGVWKERGDVFSHHLNELLEGRQTSLMP